MIPASAFDPGFNFEEAAMFSTALLDGSALTSVADENNVNIRPEQKELLLLHQKLGHANFQWLKTLCAQPRNDPLNRGQILPTRNAKVSTSDPVLCAACQLGK